MSADQARFLQKNDPPLMSDIAAVADATSAPGRISTIAMAADVSWSPTEVLTPPVPARPPATVAAQRVREIARTGLPDR
jgi:hypothetical protein